MTYLPTTEKVLCFKYYDFLLYILHAEYALRYGEIACDGSLFVELVNAVSMRPKIVKSQYHNFPKTTAEQSSRFQFLRAQDLMENLTGSNSCPEFQLLSLMSKGFLRKALEYDDFKANGVAPAALAYLDGLHFATSEYRPGSGVCLPVIADQTSQLKKETLNAGCLLFFDDVSRIVGLWVLHKKIIENKLHYTNRRLYLDLRLSPEVFTHYLTVISAERISKHMYFYDNFPDPAFPMDEYLKALLYSKCCVSRKSGNDFFAKREIFCWRRDLLTETETSISNPSIVRETVINILMDYALENLTSFCSVIRKDFGIQCNTADCYRALYLYKFHKYDELLNLCEQILRESDLQNDLMEFTFVNVLLLPPFDSFFDTDVQSLLGFHTLFHYLSPLNDSLRKLEFINRSVFSQCFVNNVLFRDNGLSFFTHDQYSIKCHYFLGRHFLARYLKVRSLTNCNISHRQALTEFAAQKTSFPFELIIRRFLLRKLRVNKR